MENKELGETLAQIWMPPNCTVLSIHFEQRFCVPDVFLRFSNKLGFRFTEYMPDNMRFVWQQSSEACPAYMCAHMTAYSYDEKIYNNVDGYENADFAPSFQDERRAFVVEWTEFVALRAKLTGRILYGTGHERIEDLLQLRPQGDPCPT